jgi:Raf kinase inhibitor-like YbhB/YbcL family protein
VKIASDAFADGGHIPSKYTCDGNDVSPPMQWSDLPARTKSVALICDDPDAPKKDFTHWVLYDLPPSARMLPEHVSRTRELPDGGRQGKNDFGKVGYGGPCPPSGRHRYRFTLYALDTELGVPPPATRSEVENAMKGHILETAQLTGLYAREGGGK